MITVGILHRTEPISTWAKSDPPVTTLEESALGRRRGHVWFHAHSRTKTAAYFSDRIGVRPTRLAEIGDPTGNGRSGRRHKETTWTLRRECSEDAIEPLDDALLQLLAQFDGREDVLDELRSDFELRIQCYGSSDSTQGGFWLGLPGRQRLGRLGVDFICMVYLDGSDDEQAEDEGQKVLRSATPGSGAAWGKSFQHIVACTSAGETLRRVEPTACHPARTRRVSGSSSTWPDESTGTVEGFASNPATAWSMLTGAAPANMALASRC